MSFGRLGAPRMDASNSYPLKPLKSPTTSIAQSLPSDSSTLGGNDPNANSTESSSHRTTTHVGDPEGNWNATHSLDYERKYPPDKEFTEMGPTARVWMTYNDEATKIVVEAVEDWREGLDMLLVFAAIFSAVVTTFVVQTCQNLQVNYSEVTATLVLELIKLEYAIATGDKLSSPSLLDAAGSSFRSQKNDLWVNGLWFSSLGLSLSTALITVLVKQWIHQYMSVPSGTPRDQARTRQFRNDSFQKWHVPLMIGVLPVFMHLSLGMFLLGLVLYLHKLNGIMAAMLGCIGGLAFLVYFSTNLLPLFFHDCPYKTPLSHYAYYCLRYVRVCVQSLFLGLRAKTASVISRKKPPASLKAAERRIVRRNADKLEARAIVWMHNASPNLSVQSIALQALSSLPLQSVQIVEGAAGIVPSVHQAMEIHYRIDQPVDRYERFQRGAIRFGDGRLMMPLPESNRYTRLLHASPYAAVNMLREHLLGLPAQRMTRLDVVFWARIFQNALRSGIDWLEINSVGPPSRIWSMFLIAGARTHSCNSQNCNNTQTNLRSFSLESGPLEVSEIVIDSYDLETNGTTTSLIGALTNNMRPSFVRWLLHVGFPGVVRSRENYTHHVPPDVLLVLTMLQSPSIQATSLRRTDDDDSDYDSLFRQVLRIVELYAVGSASRTSKHKDFDRAAIVALKAVLRSDSFGTSSILSLEDEGLVVKSLFSALNRRYEFSGTDDHDYTWLTPDLFNKSWRVASMTTEESAETIAHVLTYVVSTRCHLYATERIMSDLVTLKWLPDIDSKFVCISQSANPHEDRIGGDVRPGHAYLAAAYVSALSTLDPPSSTILDHLREPENFAALCKLLLLSDVDAQRELWNLAKILRGSGFTNDCWSVCLQDLAHFVKTPGAESDYEDLRMFRKDELRLNKGLYYRPFDDLPSILETFADDVKHGRYAPPVIVKPSDTQTLDAIQSPSESDEDRNSILRSCWNLKRIFCGKVKEPVVPSEISRRESLEWSKSVARWKNIIPNP